MKIVAESFGRYHNLFYLRLLVGVLAQLVGGKAYYLTVADND